MYTNCCREENGKADDEEQNRKGLENVMDDPAGHGFVDVVRCGRGNRHQACDEWELSRSLPYC